MEIKNITIVGSGYVGTSLGIMFSQKLNTTIVDTDTSKVKKINNKISPIKDLDIDNYLSKKNLKINAVKSLKSTFKKTDLYILCLPTDYDPEKDIFNTNVLERIINEINLNDPCIPILIKSTVPIGFTDNIKLNLERDDIIFSPEFLREGSALKDNLNPTRIVIGDTGKIGKIFADLFKSFAHNNPQCFCTESHEAESIKLFSNTYLAMRISFFNELDSFCLDNSMDTKKIIKSICADSRIGEGYNNPSFGYGGYCLPKDSKQLVSSFKGASVKQVLLSSIVESNVLRKRFIAKKIYELKPKFVGIYRLIMKNGSDNIRDASIIDVIKNLKKLDVNIFIYEPMINSSKFKGCKVFKNFEEFCTKSDLIIANRFDKSIEPHKSKVFSRDIFNEN